MYCIRGRSTDALIKPAPASCILGALCALALQAAAAQGQHDLLHAPGRIEFDAGALYEGRFADGTPFQMALAYPEPDGLAEQARGLMQSAYWYPRRFTGQVAPLTAQDGPPGMQVLAVLPDSGAAAQERFAIALGADRRDGKGNWTSAAGKELTFTLKRSVRYRAVVLARPAPAAQAAGEERQFVFSALFPVFGERALDAWVRDVAGHCRADLECRNQVLVRWRSPGQLSLDASSWTYSYGAAHGNYRSGMRHYATADDAAVLTRFTAFVGASAACRDQVSAALVAKLDAQGLTWADQGALDYLAEPKFIPTPAGIEFHWDPYQVGSYAQGAPSVFLTRAELGDCAGSLPRYD